MSSFKKAVHPRRYANRRSPIRDRFLAKVLVIDGCWVWQAHIQPTGYGQFTNEETRAVPAHRWAYEHWIGPIPEGLHIDHLCNNRACVNPSHLEAVTQAENTRRAYARQPLCRNGRHPKNGLGTCRPCEREQSTRASRRFRARKKEMA